MTRNIIIWGTGREARAAAALVDGTITFVDDAPDGPGEIDGHKIVRGNFAALLESTDIIVKSPGISLYDPRIAGKNNVTSLLNLWFEQKPGAVKTICISGTKGKSTTATLLHHVLKKLGMNAVLSGNIGNPLSPEDYAADTVVIEVSSYQAADFTGLCDIGVVSNLYEEHLDWHGSRDRYFADKLNLLAHAKVKFIGAQAQAVSQYEGAQVIPPARALPDNTYLKRTHNAANVGTILAIAQVLGLDESDVLQAMDDFKGLPHRQYELGVKNGVLFVDDSIATTPQSTAAALDVYSCRTVTLIAGGFDRGIDYTPLALSVMTHDVAAVICLGPSGQRIHELLRYSGFQNTAIVSNMAGALKLARETTPKGGVILLSPAAPSYGLFTDFQERGRAFAKAAGF